MTNLVSKETETLLAFVCHVYWMTVWNNRIACVTSYPHELIFGHYGTGSES